MRRMNAFCFAATVALALAGGAASEASAATGWRTLEGPTAGAQLSAVAGDGTSTLAYARGADLKVLDGRTLTKRTVALTAGGCGPVRVAGAAVLVRCPQAVGLVRPGAGFEQLAGDNPGVDQPGGPADVLALGDQWLARLNAGPTAAANFVDFVDWHTGTVLRDPSFPMGDFQAFDLDDSQPGNPSTCAPGKVLDRRGDRYLMLRATSRGGAVYITTCSGQSRSRLLGHTRRGGVTGQLGSASAVWAQGGRVTAARLDAARRLTWTFSGLARVESPLAVAQAGRRLLVSELTSDHRRRIVTRSIPF